MFTFKNKRLEDYAASAEAQTQPNTRFDTTSDWRPALHAAVTAFTAFRNATAHRGNTTVDEIPADDAPVAAIRDWINDVRRIIIANPAGRILLSDMQTVLHSPILTAEYLRRATADIDALHSVNVTGGQLGAQSWALPSETDRVVPVWTSRTAWLAQVAYALGTTEGTAACKAHCTVPRTVQHHAAVYAELVGRTTGRGLTASRKTIVARTGLSASAEQRARRVLRELGLLAIGATGRTLTTVEHLAAALHHGGHQSRAASTLHLSTPQWLAHVRPPTETRRQQPARPDTSGSRPRHDGDHLSLSGFSPEECFSSGENNQTRVRARARHSSSIKPGQSRPLHLQRAAAELLRLMPGIRIRHIGSICHLISAAGIDTTTWTGADIAAALNDDTRRRGWLWPTIIDRPEAFLAWRFRRISWTGTSPSAAARQAAERRDRHRMEAAADAAARDRLRASKATRDAAKAMVHAALTARSSIVTTGTPQTSLPPIGRMKTTATSARSAARAELRAVRLSRTNAASWLTA